MFNIPFFISALKCRRSGVCSLDLPRKQHHKLLTFSKKRQRFLINKNKQTLNCMFQFVKTILRTHSTHEIVPKGKEMGSDADIMTQVVITMVNKCLICSLRFIFFLFWFPSLYLCYTLLCGELQPVLKQTSPRQELGRVFHGTSTAI